MKLKPRGVLGVAIFWVVLILAACFPVETVHRATEIFLLAAFAAAASWAIYEIVVTLWEN